MRPAHPREAILIDQIREKLTQFSKRVLSQTELIPLIVELRAEHAFPRSLSERSFLRRLIEDGILKEIPLSATYSFDAKRYHWGPFSDHELALSLKPGAYGIAKDVDLDYPRRAGIQGVSFAREERFPQLLMQGWCLLR
jgi:hypothetical protein